MFGVDIAPKENFLTYSTQCVFSTIRLVPGNVVMVAINMCRKIPITAEWICGITWKHVYLNIFVLVIVDTPPILKLVFPSGYCLSWWLLWSNFFLIFVVIVVIATVAFVVVVIAAFCVCLVIIAKLMRMFSILVLLFAPYFTVNSVDKWFKI